jgi:hypothetical protein
MHNASGLADISNRLSPPLPSHDEPHTSRHDGWTPDRIQTFLHTLAECGVVSDAARAAGMSKQSVYAFRNSARGRGFDTAWRAALLVARGRIADEVMSRALNGCVEVIVRDGEVWGERHRYDNRLTMAVLTRLDALAASPSQLDDAPRRVAHEFDAFVDAVCEGNAQAVGFIRARKELPHAAFDEAEIVARNEAYRRSREEGSDVEWQLETSSTSLDLEVRASGPVEGKTPPSDDGPCALPDSSTSGAAVAAQEQALERCARQADDDEWQQGTSSISLAPEEAGSDLAARDIPPDDDILRPDARAFDTSAYPPREAHARAPEFPPRAPTASRPGVAHARHHRAKRVQSAMRGAEAR